MTENRFRTNVSWLSFFFMLLVIFAHAVNIELFLGPEGKKAAVGAAESVLGDQLSQVAVPGFFVLSSVLFFRNYDLGETKRKLLSRVKSLLIPYLLWNALYYFGYCAATRLPGLSGVVGKEPVAFTAAALFRGVFLHSCNYSFWFLFQLLLLTALSPAVYLIASNPVSFFGVEALLLACIFFRIDRTPVNADAFFYYLTAAGITLAVRPKNWKRRDRARKARERRQQDSAQDGVRRGLQGVETGRKQSGLESGRSHAVTVQAALALAGFTGILYLTALKTMNDLPLVLARLLAVGVLWFWFSSMPLSEPAPFMRNTFLCYAIHFAPVRFINKTAAAILKGNAAAAIVLYLLMPAVVLLLTELFARLGRTLFPGFYSLLTGGRE